MIANRSAPGRMSASKKVGLAAERGRVCGQSEEASQRPVERAARLFSARYTRGADPSEHKAGFAGCALLRRAARATGPATGPVERAARLFSARYTRGANPSEHKAGFAGRALLRRAARATGPVERAARLFSARYTRGANPSEHKAGFAGRALLRRAARATGPVERAARLFSTSRRVALATGMDGPGDPSHVGRAWDTPGTRHSYSSVQAS